jgi:hypothetical protein
MCQAYEAEWAAMARWERENGTCKLGHLRWHDGVCMQGALCPENDWHFGEPAAHTKDNKFRKENERKCMWIHLTS